MTTPVKFNLRLPAELHEQAAAIANQLGISLNAFAVLALRNWVDYQGAKQRAPVRAGLQAPTAQARSVPVVSKERDPSWPKVGRNEPCPCGSGKKSKFCHGAGA